jgi:hypothetical protein
MNINFELKTHWLWEHTWKNEIRPDWKMPNIFCHILFKYANDIGRLSDINHAIETGTYEGNSSICFSYLFETVHTIEKYPDYNPYNHKSLISIHNDIKNTNPNINFHYGNSPDHMREIFIKNPDTDYFILLDAHTGSESPVMEELKCIKDYSNSNNHVIMIDDCNTISVDYDKILEINPRYNIIHTGIGSDIVLIY